MVGIHGRARKVPTQAASHNCGIGGRVSKEMEERARELARNYVMLRVCPASYQEFFSRLPNRADWQSEIDNLTAMLIQLQAAHATTNVRYCGHEAPIGKPCP